MPELVREKVTRRQLLQSAGGAAATVALGGAAVAASRLARTHHPSGVFDDLEPAHPITPFHSRPDLRPAAVAARGMTPGDGYLFLGPGSKGGSQSGPLIVDHSGSPVWFKPVSPTHWETNFTTGVYRGEPVLTWWEGRVVMPVGYGQGEGVLVDGYYRELGRVRAARGRLADMHEFRLTPEGTAIITCYPATAVADLSAIGGPRKAQVLESVFQEIDLRTGRLLLEWRSLDHIPVSESYRPLEHPYDYLHINSVDVAPDGNLLVSGRHTWALYKLERRTGAVIWRLGGKRSDFALERNARFAWQHDARFADAGTVTVFDNGSDGPTKTESESRGVALALDERARTAKLAGTYRHGDALLTSSMGSVQTVAGGRRLVSWGKHPRVSEFTADGRLVGEAAMVNGQQSYRVFRLPWTGRPLEPVAVSARSERRSDRTLLHVSWNGATEVTHWQVFAGPSARSLKPAGVAARLGFETAIVLAGRPGYVAVAALNGASRRLGASGPVKVGLHGR